MDFKKFVTLVLTLNNFLINSYLSLEICIISLQQILSFLNRLRQFEMKNFLRWAIMVADNITLLVAPENFFHF